MKPTAVMVAVVLVATGISATPAHAEQVWRPCTETLERWQEVIDDNGEAECAFVTVPLDYNKPDDRKLKLAVSRLKAKGERRGVLLSNPGGPGGSAIAYPFDLRASTIGGVAQNHDLIGFDPRGVGFSDAQFCDFPDQPTPPPPRNAEQKARDSFEYEAEWNRVCAAGDPEFVAQLTTENTARDMDEIRKALGERKISFYGVSFGTAIGAYYRSLFDSSVDRMWLDSVMPPAMDMSRMDSEVAAVQETRFEPFLRWLAARDYDYHLGKDSAEVRRTLLALRTELDNHPRGDTDGSVVGGLLTPDPPSYAWSAAELMTLLENGGGVASLAVAGDGAPERPRFESNGFAFNLINNRAMLCNDGTGGRDFARMWAARQERLRQYPAAGGIFQMSGQCPSWPVPARPWQLARGTSALQLSGHIGENVTPYAWARQMQARIGGALLTVEDDQHGSVRRSPCGAKVVEFFRTGRGDNGTCEGV